MHELIIAGAQFQARRAQADCQLLLHCDPNDAPQIGRLTGLDLPDVMLTSGQAGGWHALHLSPDEWLLIANADEANLGSRFAAASQQFPLSLVDVSERSLSLDIDGDDATLLLNGACPVDFDTFQLGGCTRTLIGKVTVMLWRRGQTVRMSYPRSYDAYVCGLLTAIGADLAQGAR